MSEIIMYLISGSSQISQIGYDADTEKLRINFVRGHTYEYHPVSQSIYDELMGSESIGSAFARLIKGNASINFHKV